MLKLEAPKSILYCCGVPRMVPPIPRGLYPGLPTLEEALPHRIYSQYVTTMKHCAVQARMFCFSAFIDGFPGFFTDFVEAAPRWCEVCYYELPGSGTRRSEALPETVDELAEDAWNCLAPAFQQMRRGGIAEGCPFSFNGFAISNNLMMLIAARARAEFGLEPCCVFVLNAAPPSRPFLNQTSRQRMARGDPDVLSDYVLHIIGTKSDLVFDKVHHHLSSFIQMTSNFVDSVDHIFHVFRSPLYVFVDRYGYSRQYEARTQLDFNAWVHWTTESCEIFTIESEAPKATIRYHSEVTSKMWKEFGKHVEPL